MPTENWKNIFAYDLPTVGPKEHKHEPGECSENCQMAREVKCVCRCGGKNHGAALKRDIKKLDDFNGSDEETEQALAYIS